MDEVEDEPLFRERAAGIDIGKQAVMVTIRVPSETRKGGRAQETREFGTTRRQLLELADWLRCWGVQRAGMEATSDYWKPVVRHEALRSRAGVKGPRRRSVAAGR
jgi:transposase